MKLERYEKAHSVLEHNLQTYRDNAISALENCATLVGCSASDMGVLSKVVSTLICKPEILRQVRLAAKEYGVLRFLEANAP